MTWAQVTMIPYMLLANEIVDWKKTNQATPLKVEKDALFGDIIEDD